MDETAKTYINPLQSLAAYGLKGIFPSKKYCSTFCARFGVGFWGWFWVSVGRLLPVPGLWENLPDGRSPRQRRGGIFHTPRAGLFRLVLTVEQLTNLDFALLCQIDELEEGREADHPEVIAALGRLAEVKRRTAALLGEVQP